MQIYSNFIKISKHPLIESSRSPWQRWAGVAGRTDERENEKNKKLEEWRDTTELIQFGALPVFDFQKKK